MPTNKRKAIFLDRDGTINFDCGSPHRIEDLRILPGAVEGLQLLQDMGFLLVILTNQSGIARGMYGEAEYQQFTDELLARLRTEGVQVARVYHCPHLDSGCDCRKPATGMFRQAQKDFSIDYSQSYAIGDKVRDLCICNEEPVTGVLISSEPQGNDSFAHVPTLLDAALFVQKHRDGERAGGMR